MITRRSFLGSIPMVWVAGKARPLELIAKPTEKLTLLDIDRYATDGLSPAEISGQGWYDPKMSGLSELQSGLRELAGVAFHLPEAAGRRILILGEHRPAAKIPIHNRFHYLCVAHFCDRHPEDTAGPFGAENPDSPFEPVGQHLATYSLVYEDGTQMDEPIRRRYEINPPVIDPSHVPAAALPSFEPSSITPDAPLESAYEWGIAQTGLDRRAQPKYGSLIWVCALANPKPDKEVQHIELSATGKDLLAVCALTLFHRPEHPLRREPLRRFEITLPAAEVDWQSRWNIRVDLGRVGRVFAAGDFNPNAWMKNPYKGLGEPVPPERPVGRLIAEITASTAATLTVEDRTQGLEYHYDLAGAVEPEVRILDPDPRWLHAQVVEEATGRPCAARVSFRSPEGRYLAPYGHAEEISTGWMQNSGPDVRIGGASHAYIDGDFQIELPVGEAYVEISKGFEFEPIRRKIKIQPGQTELVLPIRRALEASRSGWVTADTHVHFGSPQLLVLEGAAEGLDLVNLLAAQWGRLVTNFVDPPGRFAGSTAETTVWVGSENRNHFLGHIGLLGLHKRVVPFSTSGPPVAYFGSPLVSTLAEWADACREQGGVTVGVHFPIPNGETAADVVLGKLDAAEIRYDHGFAALGVTEYYRYLNCGYRLAAAGGTDKMSARRAVGASRTYARLHSGESVNFESWARAVRAGRTFVTTGPLLFLKVEGREPGDTLEIGNGRVLTIQATVESIFPVGEVEIVHNGTVIASGRPPLRESFQLKDPGWLAARCSAPKRLSYGMRNIGAHTSPVYLTREGKGAFSVPAGEYMLKLIEGPILWLDTVATPGNREQMARARRILEEAQNQLETKIHQHKHL